MNILQIKNVTVGEGRVKIIIPLISSKEEDLLEEGEIVKDLKPDIVEWRADFYELINDRDAAVHMLSKLRILFADTPLIFTFRTNKEGGNTAVSDAYYADLLRAVIQSKAADLIDIELFSQQSDIKELVSMAKTNGVFIIMSSHDFKGTPSKNEIIQRLCRMQELGSDITKIAVMPQSAADVLVLLDATYTMFTTFADRPMITMSMAGTGVISRLAGNVFGSSCTFGSGSGGSAPGQIPAEELRSVLKTIETALL